MKSVSFSITRVNCLRCAAVRARTALAEGSDRWRVESLSNGWFAYADANDLIRVFDTLWLKDGFAPRAYESGGSSRGVIWAVPADTPLVAPGEWSRLEDTWLPRPPGAVPLMQAIEGDGSPWSYLSASILSRESSEFGARWPGCVWTDQTILSKPPRQADDPDVSDDERKLTADAPVGNWTWRRPAAQTWKPAYAERGATRKIVLHIYSPFYGDEIYRATDTYPAGSHHCKTRTMVLCKGEGGICY